MTALNQTKYARLDHDAAVGALTLTWHPETEAMDDAVMGAEVLVLAKAAVQHDARVVMIDAREFRHRPSDAWTAYQEAEIFPRYREAAVARRAFLMPDGAPVWEPHEATQGMLDAAFADAVDYRNWALTGFAVHVAVSYTLSRPADPAFEQRIGEFVARAEALGDGIEYTSTRELAEPRRFVHIVRVPTRSALEQMQSQEWFKAFGPWLKPQCAEGPAASLREVLASTLAA